MVVSARKEAFKHLNKRDVALDFMQNINGKHLLALELKYTRYISPTRIGRFSAFNPDRQQHAILRALAHCGVPVRYCANTVIYDTQSLIDLSEDELNVLDESLIVHPDNMKVRLPLDFATNNSLRQHLDDLIDKPADMFAGIDFMFNSWAKQRNEDLPGARFLLLAFSLVRGSWEIDVYDEPVVRVIFENVLFREIRKYCSKTLERLKPDLLDIDEIGSIFKEFQLQFNNAVRAELKKEKNVNWEVARRVETNPPIEPPLFPSSRRGFSR